MTIYKHPYDDLYIAPIGQAFYNLKGENLGRFLWQKSVDGIYLDDDDKTNSNTNTSNTDGKL